MPRERKLQLQPPERLLQPRPQYRLQPPSLRLLHPLRPRPKPQPPPHRDKRRGTVEQLALPGWLAPSSWLAPSGWLRLLARPIPSQVESLQLLSNYIEGLCTGPALSTPEVARLAVAHIYDLAALTMGATRDAAEIAKGRGLRVARLRAIKTDIAERLASPDLSEKTVAMRQRVSPRYVQMLFEQEGITFSQYVIGQRLVRAYRMLTDPRFADRSITWLALHAGFGDLSYFNRAFRRCYGSTPSEIRADAIRRKDA